jgi:hypothetical protein
MSRSFNSFAASGALGFEEGKFLLLDFNVFEVDGCVVEVDFLSAAPGFFLSDEVSFKDLFAVNGDEEFFFGGKLHFSKELILINMEVKWN